MDINLNDVEVLFTNGNIVRLVGLDDFRIQKDYNVYTFETQGKRGFINCDSVIYAIPLTEDIYMK